MKQRGPNLPVLWFTKLTGVPAALLFFKPKVYYVNKAVQSLRLPKPCILMSNHKSLMDFVLYLCLFFGRTLRFLMAEVLFRKGKLFSWMLFALGGVYVDRDAFDFGFISESIKILDKGGTVGIFPEGRLPINGKPWPFKPSIVLIALHAGVPIVPLYTDGNYGLFKRARVVVGTPIDLRDYCDTVDPDEQQLKQLTALLEQKTQELKEFLEQHA